MRRRRINYFWKGYMKRYRIAPEALHIIILHCPLLPGSRYFRMSPISRLLLKVWNTAVFIKVFCLSVMSSYRLIFISLLQTQTIQHFLKSYEILSHIHQKEFVNDLWKTIVHIIWKFLSMQPKRFRSRFIKYGRMIIIRLLWFPMDGFIRKWSTCIIIPCGKVLWNYPNTGNTAVQETGC